MSTEKPAPEERTPRKPRRWRRHWRWFVYPALAMALVMAYLVSFHGAIPGYDPYFLPREAAAADIWKEDGRRWLRGGTEPHQHFDITEFELDPDRLEYGLGRDAIKAVYEPVFVSVEEAEPWLRGNARVLLASQNGETKIYPLDILREHEVVNDELGGEPVTAVFCPLADLGALYERRIGGETYTFAASGYTYYDWRYWNGYSAFVLWDRETESLWWPPAGKAVSGPSIHVPMRVLDNEHWAQTTWHKASTRYPDANVLHRHQPTEMPTVNPTPVPKTKRYQGQPPDSAIPPRWGRNETLSGH